MQTAEYISSKKSTGRAGDCSLADIGVQTVPRDVAQQLLQELPDKDPEGKAKLRRKYESCFADWAFELSQGFSLCFHGFGSKQRLLLDFAKSWLADGSVLAVHGMRHGATARQILLHAAATHLSKETSALRSKSEQDLLASIREHDVPLTIVLHNIDGPGLRTSDAQSLLSELAACDNVRFLASFDDVNTPILWDNKTDERFNWLWHDVTTYEPYTKELADGNIPPVLGSGSVQANKTSAVQVLSQFPVKAKGVFRIIVQHQRDRDGPGGVDFMTLFSDCRRKFLVGVESNLKGFLAEFRDHDLVATRRAPDGAELFYVPMRDDLLTSVLEELDA